MHLQQTAEEYSRSSVRSREDLYTFLQIIQFLKASFPNPDIDYDPTSVPEPITQALSKHYTRF